MKKLTRFFSFTTIFGLTLAAACCKDKPPTPCDDNGLPCATHEGLNTFGCIVNGVNWVAETSFTVGGPIALEGEFDEATGDFWLKGTRRTSNESVYEYIRFFGVNIDAIGVHEMSVLNEEIMGFYDFNTNYPCQAYYHDTLNKGSLNIAYLNTQEGIIAGTFNVALINTICGDTLYLSDGRFDFGY